MVNLQYFTEQKHGRYYPEATSRHLNHAREPEERHPVYRSPGFNPIVGAAGECYPLVFPFYISLD